MAGLVSNFPTGAGRWELVATLAKQRGVLTATLVAQLQRLGAKPKRVSGVWMINSRDWAEVEHLLQAAPAPQEHKPAPAAASNVPAPAKLPDAMQAALDRQAAQLQQLQERLAALQAATGGNDSPQQALRLQPTEALQATAHARTERS